MKRIYFVMLNMAGGGAEKVITRLANNLSRDKFQVNLILFKKEGPNLNELNPDIKIIDLGKRNSIFKLFKLIKLLKILEIDILFTSLGPLNAILSPILYFFKDFKKIARETNIPSYIHDMKIKDGKKYYYIVKFLYKISYRNYDVIIAQSNDMKDDLIKNYKIDVNKIKKINNFIDFKELNQKINSKEIINKKDKKIKLIFAGRLTHQKGIDLLLEQISKIKTIDFELLILGVGELENQLSIKIKDLKLEKKVKMLGYQKNPYIYFSQSDIFILPSRIEGFPNVAIESLALGIPIIANDFKGGINEIIIDKFNGKIINFELENNFEKIICDTLNFRKNKKEIIADTYFKYGIQKILTQYEDVFLKI